MAAGETHAFYITPTDFSTGGFNYTNGTATGDVFASDANLEFLEHYSNHVYGMVTFSILLVEHNLL